MTITPEQKLQLIGLGCMGVELIKQLDLIEKAAMEITKEPEKGGLTGDWVWGSRDLEELIKYTEQYRTGENQ